MTTRIRSLAEARALFASPAPVSFEAQAGLAGIGWWRDVLAALAEEFPGRDFTAVLDCGHSTGLALAAIREGIPLIRVSAPPEVMEKLKAMGTATNVLSPTDEHR